MTALEKENGLSCHVVMVTAIFEGVGLEIVLAKAACIWSETTVTSPAVITLGYTHVVLDACEACRECDEEAEEKSKSDEKIFRWHRSCHVRTTRYLLICKGGSSDAGSGTSPSSLELERPFQYMKNCSVSHAYAR
ncbi:uncharacterized protein MYCFIDRAFT_180543 [Pseudocercospora fijiensis CIRAD86]|uniref:Uncharacterized protein n=1 Tax=Pseudocercospora fijiensis (strain CIRAD86) TaxID=383855 RepID=M2ZCP4_PSEFD|nr:uncharacterized protein MYCFIDRAFT_180543 [Pseudocercospora fijiensis CIRAD86]EME76884.1 hypothetical protein MYCFIDRAFT_180543 [Pseudocercospora fijiensis CIRAD86]